MSGIKRMAIVVTVALVGVACGAGGTGGTTGGTSCSKTWKVGLVTDVGKLSDKSFNFDSYKGVQDAQADKALCVQGRAIESSTEDDYGKNIQQFLDQNYDLIIGVGFKLGDAIIKAAKANPNTKFMLVDSADFADNPPPQNLVGLLFKEDQPGFLAGALAGLMTKSNTIGAVVGLQTVPPVVRYTKGYENGAKFTNPKVKVLTIYQPESGPKAQALTFIGQGADIIFGAGGNTGNGALLGTKEQGKTCIGVDVDQYLSYPDVDSCLVTSAEKHLDLAVKTGITNLVKSQWQAGVLNFDIKNDGIGLAPYHDFDSKVPADVKAKIQDIQSKLKDGSLSTGVTA